MTTNQILIVALISLLLFILPAFGLSRLFKSRCGRMEGICSIVQFLGNDSDRPAPETLVFLAIDSGSRLVRDHGHLH